MHIDEILMQAKDLGASDVHLAVDNPITIRVDGELIPMGEQIITAEDTAAFARHMIKPDRYNAFEESGQIDISYRIPKHSTYRINIYK